MSKARKDKHFIKQPVYQGGPKALTEFIYRHLQYPPEAFEAGIEGMVLVDFDIDHKGKVVATRVLQSIGHGCDEEACRVIKLLQYEVGKNRGVNVVFHQKAKIYFKRPLPAEQPTAELPENLMAPPAPYSVTITTTTTTTEQPSSAPPQVFTYTIKL